MTTTTTESRGRIVYVAYGRSVNWTTHDGQPMLSFDELATQTRAGRVAAAQVIWDLATSDQATI